MKKIVFAIALLAGCFDEAAPVPTCKSMGCDGTQEVPLYCPGPDDDPMGQPYEGTCFCTSPDEQDGWCRP